MFPFRTPPEERPLLLALAAGAVLQAILLFLVSYRLADAHFMFPLDDAYIHLQYARRCAQGAWLSYGAGLPPSGGMTSPLYVAFLLPVFWAGLSGVKAALAAFAFGAATWALAVCWGAQLARRIAGPSAGGFAGALLLANGHLLWNFFSGMETGLFTLLALGIVLAAHAWWSAEEAWAPWVLLLFLALFPLIRPEGLVAHGVLVAVLLARRGQGPRISLLAVAVTVVPFLAWLAALHAATGDWRPAGLVVKGLLSHPYLPWEQKAAFVADTLHAIPTRFFANLIPDAAYAAFKGTQTLPYAPAGLMLLALFGGAWHFALEGRAGRPAGGAFLALLWILGLASVSASFLPFIHQQRYLAPWTALAVVLALVGLRRLAQLFQQHEAAAFRAGAMALLLLSVPSVPFWMAEHGRNARDIYHLLRRATFALEQRVEPFGVTDAGVLAYYTQAPAVDFVGLCAPQFTRAMAHGEGATLEALARLPSGQAPAVLLTYREWFSPSFPLGPAQLQVQIPQTTITSGTALGTFPIQWERVRAGALLPDSAGRVLREVNVASLPSEAAAGYRFSAGPYAAEFVRRWPSPFCVAVDVSTTVSLVREDGASTPTLVRAVEGGRVVFAEEFDLRFTKEELFGAAAADFPSAGTQSLARSGLRLLARVGATPPDNPLGPSTRRLRVLVRSGATGAVAERSLLLPAQGVAWTDLDLAGALDEVGGLDLWHVRVESAEPSDASWLSCRYLIARPQ